MSIGGVEEGTILNCTRGNKHITVDKEYIVLDTWENYYINNFDFPIIGGYVRIVDDGGYINSYHITSFELTSEKRNRIINEILKV